MGLELRLPQRSKGKLCSRRKKRGLAGRAGGAKQIRLPAFFFVPSFVSFAYFVAKSAFTSSAEGGGSRLLATARCRALDQTLWPAALPCRAGGRRRRKWPLSSCRRRFAPRAP